MRSVFTAPGNHSDRYPHNLGMHNPNHRAKEYNAINAHDAHVLIERISKSYNPPQRRARKNAIIFIYFGNFIVPATLNRPV